MKKTFDCIAMKSDLQRKLQEECMELSPEERRQRMSERILSDPMLASLYVKAKAQEDQKKMMVAEEVPEYGKSND